MNFYSVDWDFDDGSSEYHGSYEGESHYDALLSCAIAAGYTDIDHFERVNGPQDWHQLRVWRIVSAAV